MTKKDYELIAGVIKAQRKENTENPILDELSTGFAYVLQATNPRFNHSLFLKACGVSE